MNVVKIEDVRIGQQIDWKFGLVTRVIYRVDEKWFEITDMSDGWMDADATLDEMKKLISGEMSLSDLDWY